jgi:hypothetical protein
MYDADIFYRSINLHRDIWLNVQKSADVIVPKKWSLESRRM